MHTPPAFSHLLAWFGRFRSVGRLVMHERFCDTRALFGRNALCSEISVVWKSETNQAKWAALGAPVTKTFLNTVQPDETKLIFKRRQNLRKSLDPEAAQPDDKEKESTSKPAEGSKQEKEAAAPGGETLESESSADRFSYVRNSLSGLAFSGGGIRSATFNLGILQALAGKQMLRRFDYLSTVSGGGYIGSWLTARLHRQCKCDAPIVDVEAAIAPASDQAADDTGKKDFRPDDSIAFLRRYSNYLTPKVGLLSADTWSAVATYLRNLLLNLIILVATGGVLLLIPRLSASVLASLNGSNAYLWLIAGSVLLSLLPGYFIGCNLAAISQTDDTKTARNDQKKEGTSQKIPEWLRLNSHGNGKRGLLAFAILPLLLLALGASLWLAEIASPGHSPILPDMGLPSYFTAHESAWTWAGWVAFINASVWGAILLAALFNRSRWSALKCFQFIVGAALAGAVAGPLLQLLGQHLIPDQQILQVTVGPPLLFAWLFLLAVLHTGVLSTIAEDFTREWLSVIGAWLMIFAIGWLALFGMVVVAPFLIDLLSVTVKSALVSGWLLATIGGIFAGRKARAEGGGTYKAMAAAVAPYVFGIGLIMLLSNALHFGMAKWSDVPFNTYQSAVLRYEESARDPALKCEGCHPIKDKIAKDSARARLTTARSALWSAHLDLIDESNEIGRVAAALALLALIAVFVSWRIDINQFSMHSFYRNRLVRAYLGASVETAKRSASFNRLTGFYQGDDIELAKLAEGSSYDAAAPYHLINGAINLSGGNDLAWQQRKAASFLMSPLYCGYTGSGNEDHFRKTKYYAADPTPLQLGDAMTVSGAAASPNMGFRTSTAFAFLMTVFNVRLGRWLGNPGSKKKHGRSGPLLSLYGLYQELFGIASDDRNFVYVSDGGHFENLGIYELVRRQCRFIVACDAGADPDLEFEDLGNAIRKCRADFGADIRIQTKEIGNRSEAGFSDCHCAVGRIAYADGSEGTLVYIKASLTGDEPEDVINYAAEHPSFPHQSTADQFFDESQFESYRRLGVHVGNIVFGPVAYIIEGKDTFNNEPLFQALSDHWHPPPTASSSAFTNHAGTLDALFERLRCSDELAFLVPQFYPEWNDLDTGTPSALPLQLPSDGEELRQGFFFCNSLIQLMENVYLDLSLEDEYDHLDNRGWMNLFRHWSWSGMFRVTWAIAACTYGSRFQSFSRRRLGLDLGRIEALELGEDTLDKLNFVEKRQVETFQAAIAELVRISGPEEREVLRGDARIFQFRTVVPGHETKELVRFPVGYAVIIAGQVCLFRIQDHLRRMGLARRCLEELFDKAPELDSVGQSPAKIARSLCSNVADFEQVFSEEVSSKNVRVFRLLFDSVMRTRLRSTA